MTKILTIAICAYNMEKYIAKAVESCICQSIDKIEVLVMNDGSTDRTAEIVKKYSEKYPDSIKLIDKKNGGWGSNLNLAVQLATGKYFKELDADDWFDTEVLEKFIQKLEENDADMFYNYIRKCYEDHSELCGAIVKPYFNQVYKLDDIKEGIIFSIWAVTYRTELLNKYHRELPEHTLYTDSLFVLQILPYVNDIYMTDLCVYQYQLGREGQSVGIESLKKHYKEYMKVMDIEFQFIEQFDKISNKQHVMKRVQSKYEALITELVKLYGEVNDDIKKIIIQYEKRIRKQYPELYKITGRRKFMKFLRKSNYLMLPLAKRIIGKRYY